MKKSNFHKWERKLFEFIKQFNQRENETSIFLDDGRTLSVFGENVCALITGVYDSLPVIPILTNKRLFHVPLCVEYKGISFFNANSESLAPNLNSHYLLGKLIYLFFCYPKYEESVLNFLEKHVMSFIYLHKVIHNFEEFCMDLRTIAEHLFFSSYHKDASPFLYAYMNRCYKSQPHHVPLFSAVKKIVFAKTLEYNSLSKLCVVVKGLHTIDAYNNIHLNFSAFYPLFSDKNQDVLKEQLSSEFAKDSVCTNYRHDRGFKEARDSFNQPLYPFELNVNQLPALKVNITSSDKLSFEQEESLQLLFDSNFCNRVNQIDAYYRNIPLRFLDGLSLDDFLQQREILKSYQNQDDLAVSFAYNKNTKYPPMPVNLYWILSDAFSRRDHGKWEIDEYYHDFLNPVLRDFKLEQIKNFFLYSQQICEKILQFIDNIDLSDLLISDNIITLGCGNIDGKIQNFIHNNKYRLREMSSIFSVANNGHTFICGDRNNSLPHVICWEAEIDPNINKYIGIDGIIYIFPKLYRFYNIRSLYPSDHITNHELNRIIMPTVWLVMCLQKWTIQQEIFELD